MVLGAEEELRGLGGMGSSEALGGSLPKLTRSWAITPSAVCDLWLMAFGRQPAPYLHACLPAWLINVELSAIPLVTWVNTSKERQLTCCVRLIKTYISAAEWANCHGEFKDTVWVRACTRLTSPWTCHRGLLVLSLLSTALLIWMVGLPVLA